MEILKRAKNILILFLLIGCARGSDPIIVQNKYLEIKLKVADPKINPTTTSSYIIIFDTDSDASDGPFIDANNNWSNYWTHYVEVKNSEFWFHKRISPDTIDTTKYQISGCSITGNTITLLVDRKELGEPNSVDVNFFVYKDITPVDALGDGDMCGISCGIYYSFAVTPGNYVEFPDSKDYTDEANLDVILLTIREKTI